MERGGSGLYRCKRALPDEPPPPGEFCPGPAAAAWAALMLKANDLSPMFCASTGPGEGNAAGIDLVAAVARAMSSGRAKPSEWAPRPVGRPPAGTVGGERRRMLDRDRGRLRGAASSRSRGHVDDQRPPGGSEPGDDPVVTYEAAPWGGPGADGPPPPPFVRERKRRRRIGLAIAAALLVIGIPIGLAIVSALAERDDPVAAPMTEDDPEDDAANDDAAGADRDDGQGTDSDEEVADPDAGADPEDGAADAGPDEGADGGPADDPDEGPEPTLRPPDVDALGGLDATYAELLLAIDDSERTMIAFQEEAVEAFADAASPADGVAAVGVVAGVRRVQLLEVRERLVDDLDDAGAEQVRTRYLEHLDSWADYMAAVEEDPALLIEGRGTGFTVVINATADAFSRALESELPADIDVEVERFAEGILDRGFRGFSEAQV